MKFAGRSVSSLPTSRRIAFAATLFGLLVIDSSNVWGQGRPIIRASHSRERTKEFIDDYTNSLGVEDGFERPRQPDRKAPAGGGQIDIKAIHPLLRAFTDNMTQLTYALNEQMDQTAGLRQIYADALKVSGSAAAIHKRLDKFGVDSAMIEDLQQLDASWHDLAYRIDNIRGLTDESHELVEKIAEADKRIRKLIGISAQLDRRQLSLKAAGLIADLENLQEDIISELGNSRDSQFYRRSINRARQTVLNLIAVLRDEHVDSAAVVEEYKQYETMWKQLSTKLREEDDRYIERGLRRVASSSTDIHQLLLLPQAVDPSQYAFLAKALKKDIDEFFERTPLTLIMSLPNAKQAVQVADQFYAACQHFVETVDRSQDQDEILESFRKVDQTERAFYDVYHDIDSDRAVAVLNRIVQTTISLQSALHIQRDEFNERTATQLAASIQNFTEQVATISRRWLEDDNQPFANECLRETADLAQSAARLHDDLVDGRRGSELKDSMAEVYEKWRTVYGYLVKCQTNERPTLGRLSNSLTPVIVDLRAMITQ